MIVIIGLASQGDFTVLFCSNSSLLLGHHQPLQNVLQLIHSFTSKFFLDITAAISDGVAKDMSIETGTNSFLVQLNFFENSDQLKHYVLTIIDLQKYLFFEDPSDVTYQAFFPRIMMRKIVHQIKNGISVIEGATFKLKKNDSVDKNLLKMILDKTNDILNSSKRITLYFQKKSKVEVDVIELIKSIEVALLQDYYNFENFIILKCDENIHPIFINFQEVEQILITLISEAVKHLDYLVKEKIFIKIFFKNKNELCLKIIEKKMPSNNSRERIHHLKYKKDAKNNSSIKIFYEEIGQNYITYIYLLF